MAFKASLLVERKLGSKCWQVIELDDGISPEIACSNHRPVPLLELYRPLKPAPKPLGTARPGLSKAPERTWLVASLHLYFRIVLPAKLLRLRTSPLFLSASTCSAEAIARTESRLRFSKLSRIGGRISFHCQQVVFHSRLTRAPAT